MPPLRERMEDLPLLAEHLLKEIAGECLCEVEPGAFDRLLQHDWPGNVRELTHALERAYLDRQRPHHCGLAGKRNGRHRRAGSTRRAGGKAELAGDFQAAMDQTERDLLERALRTAGGNKTAAAAALGMKASTFRDKLAKHGLG